MVWSRNFPGGNSNPRMIPEMGEGCSSSSQLQFEDILTSRNITDFRWASRPFYPTHTFLRSRKGAKEPKEVINIVLNSSKVKAVIKEVSSSEGEDEGEVVQRGQEILLEMTHDYRLYTIRWFAYVLSKLGRAHFSSIYVDKQKITKIKELLPQYPVVILPTHRSYVDFQLLSYVCFNYDLPLPVIAAGMDFMGMMGVAELLRKAGAFFIRRRFGDDALYRTLLTEYVKKTVLYGGHPLEMFVEGTRSRSGKSLYPKIGLLSALSELVRDREVPDVLILPVSMSYDRTLEETLYARELLGQPKPKESTNGLIKGLRWLHSQTYGSMYVKFGDFISIREALGLVEFSCPSPYTDDVFFTSTVQDMAVKVVLEQNRGLVVPLFSAVATIFLSILAQGKTSIPFQDLVKHIQIFRSFGIKFGFPLRGDTLEWNLRTILSVHEGMITCPKTEEHVVKVVRSGEGESVDGMKFQHYANQLVPKIIPFCLLSVLMGESDKDEKDINVVDIKEDYVFLRRLLFDDFIYQIGTELQEATKAASLLHIFIYKARRNGNSQGMLESASEMRRILHMSLAPFLLAYWAVAKTLLQESKGSIESKQLGKMAQSYIRQLLGSKFHPHYGALSLDTLTNAQMSFIKLDYCKKMRDPKNGSFAVSVKDNGGMLHLVNRLEQYLPELSSSLTSTQDSEVLQLKSKL